MVAESLYTMSERLQKSSGERWPEKQYFWRQLAKTQVSTAVTGGRRAFHESYRRIKEAQTSLRMCRSDHQPFAAGIIELHLAEIHLYRCIINEQSGTNDRGVFYDHRVAVFELFQDVNGIHDNPHGRAQKWREELENVKNGSSDIFASRIRHLEGASYSLDKAGTLLRSNRKNVWWVTWYYELRLRHAEYSLFSILLDNDRQIPIVGTESALMSEPTVVDGYLESAVRLVRLDTLRLANCIEAYANCMRALFVRCVIDDQAKGLSKRQNEMRKTCRAAVARLEWMIDMEKK